MAKEPNNQDDNKIYESIQNIASRIKTLEAELLSDDSDNISGKIIPDARTELNEVVKETEDAANKIMDAAEEIQNIAEKVGGEEKDKILAQATKIFEASNFQDITGQRISKVVSTLIDIQNITDELLGVISGDASIKATPSKKKQSDDDLMNGPQIAEEAPSQEDIDKLFNES